MGTSLGQYHSDNAEAQNIIDHANSVSNNDAATSTEVTEAFSALNNLTLVINQPEAGKLYRFKGHASGKYICPTSTNTSQDGFGCT